MLAPPPEPTALLAESLDRLLIPENPLPASPLGVISSKLPLLAAPFVVCAKLPFALDCEDVLLTFMCCLLFAMGNSYCNSTSIDFSLVAIDGRGQLSHDTDKIHKVLAYRSMPALTDRAFFEALEKFIALVYDPLHYEP